MEKEKGRIGMKSVQPGNRKKPGKYSRKIFCSCAITSVFTLAASPLSASAGWVQEEKGRWYAMEDGTYPAEQWIEIDGKWYHFDADGYMQFGWYQDNDGNLFWLGQDGAMVSGTIYSQAGNVYFIDPEGYCTKVEDFQGWVEDDKDWWYRFADGTWPSSQWMMIGEEWYHFDEEGYGQRGWYEENGNRYWLELTGERLHDTRKEIDGITYEFDAWGIARRAVKAPVVIPPEDQKSDLEKMVDAMADQVLAGIITPQMNDHQKAAAIYSWVRGHLSYSASMGTIGDWPTAAYEGFRRRRGHCYTYYATSLALLSRAGIPSVEVIRSTDNDHYWNLVYVDGEWLHFDTTPRRGGGNFCLLTTAQLMAYSNTHGYSHVYPIEDYPATP